MVFQISLGLRSRPMFGRSVMPFRASNGSIMRSLSGESQQPREFSPIQYPSLLVVLCRVRAGLHCSPSLGSGKENSSTLTEKCSHLGVHCSGNTSTKPEDSLKPLVLLEWGGGGIHAMAGETGLAGWLGSSVRGRVQGILLPLS